MAYTTLGKRMISDWCCWCPFEQCCNFFWVVIPKCTSLGLLQFPNQTGKQSSCCQQFKLACNKWQWITLTFSCNKQAYCVLYFTIHACLSCKFGGKTWCSKVVQPFSTSTGSISDACASGFVAWVAYSYLGSFPFQRRLNSFTFATTPFGAPGFRPDVRRYLSS